MFESLLQIGARRAPGRLHLRPAARRAGYARMLARERRPYETKDGYVCVLIYNDKQWKAFFELIGRPDLLADPRFATAGGAQPGLRRGLRASSPTEMTQAHDREWLAGAGARRHPGAAHEQPGGHPRATRTSRPSATSGPSSTRAKAASGRWRCPRSGRESAPEYRRHAPRLGEHTREVLREAGYTDSAIERLIAPERRAQCRSLTRRRRRYNPRPAPI